MRGSCLRQILQSLRERPNSQQCHAYKASYQLHQLPQLGHTFLSPHCCVQNVTAVPANSTAAHEAAYHGIPLSTLEEAKQVRSLHHDLWQCQMYCTAPIGTLPMAKIVQHVCESAHLASFLLHSFERDPCYCQAVTADHIHVMRDLLGSSV